MTAGTGFQNPSSAGADYNAYAFIARQILFGANTATLVIVKAVSNSGGIAAVGTVDVQPLVNQVDGANNAVSHGTIHSLPYLRMQGGANAIILDPQVGDIGLAIFADHDISAVIAAKGVANPGSARRFDMSDGLYLGGFLNGTPTQYVDFSSSGIKIHSPTMVTLDAPIVTITATTSVTITTPTFTVIGATVLEGPLTQGIGGAGGGATMEGPVTVSNDVTAAGVSVRNHVHGGVQTGSGDTGTPI